MKRKNTLLKKIVILFLSLVFPLLIVWLGTIQFSNQTLKRQILSSIDSNNATFIAHLNNSLYLCFRFYPCGSVQPAAVLQCVFRFYHL